MATATKVCFGGPVAWEKLGISLSTGHIRSKIWRWSTESNGETGFKPDRLKIEDIIDQKTDQKHVRDFTPRMEIEWRLKLQKDFEGSNWWGFAHQEKHVLWAEENMKIGPGKKGSEIISKDCQYHWQERWGDIIINYEDFNTDDRWWQIESYINIYMYVCMYVM